MYGGKCCDFTKASVKLNLNKEKVDDAVILPLKIETFFHHEYSLVLQQKAVLSDSLLMKLSRCVPGREIENVALEQMGIKQTDIKNLQDSRRDNIQMFSFDVLCLWRNKSVGNTKQVMKTVTA